MGFALAATVSLAACATTVNAEGTANTAAPVLVPRPSQSPRVDLMAKFELDPEAANDHWQERGSLEDPWGGDINPGYEAPNDAATGAFALPTDGLGPILGEDGVGLGDDDSGGLAPQTGMNHGTTGRLYLSHDNTWHRYGVCSATVVSSATHDIIATAGHCVWDTENGGLMEHMIFIPGDEGNAEVAPYGTWTAAEVFLRTEFSDGAFSGDDGVWGEGWAYDYAFVRLAPNSEGAKIQDVVGAQGIAFGVPTETLVVIGYPTAAPFDGRSERFCAASSWFRYQMGGYSIDCTMTPGCSGGGWFTRWDPDRGAGYLVGVSSTGDSWSLNANALGSAALELYEYAGAVNDGLFEGGG
ncbi:MAG: trypsin-like peptidase domain-containing protein [Bifidobacteriaceae bacterium]|nr:trypsin-like peptidase domain-containing protein [Bifidobacteriaceae bacterium]